MFDFLTLTLFIGMSLGGLYFWRLNLISRNHAIPLFQLRPKIPTPLGLFDVGIMFVTWVAGQLIASSLAVLWLGIKTEVRSEASTEQQALLIGMVSVGVLFATTLGMSLVVLRYRRWEVFGWRPDWLRQDILLGLVGFLMFVPPVLLLQLGLTQLIPYSHDTLTLLDKGPSVLTLSMTWLAAVLVAPICEEIFFRGTLLAWLQRAVNFQPDAIDKAINGGWDQDATPQRQPICWSAIVLSSLMFGLVHLGNGPAPISLFFFGLALGYLQQISGSVVPCIVLHAALNGFTMLLKTLPILFSLD